MVVVPGELIFHQGHFSGCIHTAVGTIAASFSAAFTDVNNRWMEDSVIGANGFHDKGDEM